MGGGNKFKIEDNIPIPRSQSARTLTGDIGIRIKRGQSVFFDTAYDAENCRQAICHRGKRAIKRKVVEDGVEGYRVWCLDKGDKIADFFPKAPNSGGAKEAPSEVKKVAAVERFDPNRPPPGTQL